MFGKQMTLSFKAEYVDIAEELDGDLLQVEFDTQPQTFDEIEEERSTPYVHISRLFEFPGPATIEWYDGQDYNGGQITLMTLRREGISIRLKRGPQIEINFQLADKKFSKLARTLRSMLDGQFRFDD
jgi:hypothetical protein